MSQPRVIVVGSFVADLVVRVPRLPRPGETVMGSHFDIYMGGKGFNQALAASRLGASVTMVGRVGADGWGQTFRDALRSEGIDATHVADDEAGTGVAVPVVDAQGQNQIALVPRANLQVTVAQVRAAASRIEAGHVLLLQREIPLEACLAAADIARGAGLPVVWNLAPAAPIDDWGLALADVLVVNEVEAGDLLGVAPASPDAARAACEALRRRGPAAAVITLGAQGATWADAAGDGHHPAFPVEAIDAVGAGDAFCAALAVTLARGHRLGAAVRAGNAAGALAATVAGAAPSMPWADAVNALLEER